MTSYFFVISGVQELLRRRSVQAGVPAHAGLQPDQVPLGEEPGRQVCLRSHLRQVSRRNVSTKRLNR